MSTFSYHPQPPNEPNPESKMIGPVVAAMLKRQREREASAKPAIPNTPAGS